jgi:outer membrane protein OmpU
VTEWSAGTQIAYGNFTVGGSFRKIDGDEALGATAGDQDATVWDAGIMYASGPWAVSFYAFQSVSEGNQAVAEDDKFTVYQVSGKYTLGAGVDALASIGHAEYDDETAEAAGGDANHNSGWAVMTGLGLTF